MRRLPSLAILAILATLALLMAACSSSPDGSAPDETLVAEVTELQRVMALDPAALPYVEAEEALARDLPVRASERLEEGAIPAAVRQVDIVGAVEVETAAGRRLRADAGRVYARRVRAWRRYAAALARGPVEDMELLDAISEVREVEEALIALHAELAEIRPSLVPTPEAAEEGAPGAR